MVLGARQGPSRQTSPQLMPTLHKHANSHHEARRPPDLPSLFVCIYCSPSARGKILNPSALSSTTDGRVRTSRVRSSVLALARLQNLSPLSSMACSGFFFLGRPLWSTFDTRYRRV